MNQQLQNVHSTKFSSVCVLFEHGKNITVLLHSSLVIHLALILHALQRMQNKVEVAIFINNILCLDQLLFLFFLTLFSLGGVYATCKKKNDGDILRKWSSSFLVKIYDIPTGSFIFPQKFIKFSFLVLLQHHNEESTRVVLNVKVAQHQLTVKNS